MAEATMRRHIAALVEAGLIIRRDSPNGKRYCRRGPAGTIAQAYGFALSPLVARERLTLLRRDCAKFIQALDGAEKAGDVVEGLRARSAPLSGLARRASLDEVSSCPAMSLVAPMLIK